MELILFLVMLAAIIMTHESSKKSSLMRILEEKNIYGIFFFLSGQKRFLSYGAASSQRKNNR